MHFHILKLFSQLVETFSVSPTVAVVVFLLLLSLSAALLVVIAEILYQGCSDSDTGHVCQYNLQHDAACIMYLQLV